MAICGKNVPQEVLVAASTVLEKTRLAGICLSSARLLTGSGRRWWKGVQCSDKEQLISNST